MKNMRKTIKHYNPGWHTTDIVELPAGYKICQVGKIMNRIRVYQWQTRDFSRLLDWEYRKEPDENQLIIVEK